MALRVIALILLLQLLAPNAGAQDHGIQTSLFDDCETAQQNFSKLAPEERTKLVDYLTRVVGLNTQAPAAPEVFAVLPGGKGLEPNPPALWQNMDAKRELRGKRCALELLTIAGPLAFDALPQLAALYSEQPLSDEIAVGIEETAATIAEQAHKNGQAPSDQDLDKVIPYLKSERSLVTKNLLHEYLSLSLPRVLTYLSNLSESDAVRLQGFLKDVDPDGGRSMRVFVELAPKLPVEGANRLASYLTYPTKEATAPLLADFARLAAEPTNGANVTALLAKGCVLLGGILIDPNLSANVSRNPNLLKENNLSEAEQRCLVSSIPSMANIILGLLTSSKEEDQKRGITLVSSALTHLDTERESALFNRLKEISSQSDSPLRPDAIRAIGLFTNRRNDANTTLTNLLKSALAAKDTNALAPVIDAACAGAVTLNSPKDLAKYAPLALEALKKGISSDGVTSLAARIDSIEPQVVKLISPNKTDLSNNILGALKTRASIGKASLPDLIEALRQPALSAAAESLLVSQGPSLIPQLRKALLKSSTTQRLGILALLEAFGGATKPERNELSNALVTSDSCALVQARPEAAQKLLLDTDLDGDTARKLTAKVASCLCSFEPDAAKALIVKDASVLFAEPEKVNALLGTNKGCDLEPSILAAAASDSISEQTRALLLTSVIERGSRPARLAALASLNRKHPLAQQALPSIRKLASEIRNDQELAYQAVLTLARLGDTQFEWPQFIKDTIDMPNSSPHYVTALETIKELPSETVLNEVTPALDSDNPDHVAGACRVGATLGSLAIPIVSKVWNLREKRSPTIKYAAILALLEINPLTPDLHTGLKAILVNRYYAAAYARPIQWRQSVAVVDLDKASFGTLRTVHLERLLLK